MPRLLVILLASFGGIMSFQYLIKGDILRAIYYLLLWFIVLYSYE